MADAFQQVVMVACLAALAATFAAVFALKVCAPVWSRLREFASLPRIQQLVLAAVVVGFIQYGATKSRFSFDGGIRNGEPPSVVTNDLVEIRWQRDMSGGVIVPESATVYVDYRLSADTNGPWVALGETKVGAWHYSTALQDSTNYDFNVWAYYIPPEPVHTNGVWVYKTIKGRNDVPIPLRARIEVNGKAIATPKQQREDNNP